MEIGIFAKTFVRADLESCLDAVTAHQIWVIQFNFSCAGLPTLPESVDPECSTRIRRALESRNLRVAAVSGTFNMIDPSIDRRRQGLNRLHVLARASRELGAPLITLCSGTRHETDMWQFHPKNSSPESWCDLLRSLEEAIQVAESYGIHLGIEPETNNVVASARDARRLLHELKSPCLKIVMDPANLFHAGELRRQGEILKEAFELLGADIALAHAKDVRDAGTVVHVAAGRGELDYDLYLRLLRDARFRGPMVLHGLKEEEANESITFLRRKIES